MDARLGRRRKKDGRRLSWLSILKGGICLKVGFCVVNYSEKPVKEVVELAARKGYEAVELPSYTGNGQVDADELLKGNNAKELKKLVEDAGLFISGISNHADSPLVLGPHGRDLASVCDGTPAEQIAFGTKSMIRSAQLASALEVPAVIAFSGIGNFGRFNDWPYPGGWADEEAAFVENWIPIFDEYKKYGVKVAFEPHPNNIVYDIHTTQRCLALCDNHPSFAINFDPANLFFTGIDVCKYIDEIGSRIGWCMQKTARSWRTTWPRAATGCCNATGARSTARSASAFPDGAPSTGRA